MDEFESEEMTTGEADSDFKCILPDSGGSSSVNECPSMDDLQQSAWTEHLANMDWCKLPSPDAVVSAEWGGTLQLHEISQKIPDGHSLYWTCRIMIVGSPMLAVCFLNWGLWWSELAQMPSRLHKSVPISIKRRPRWSFKPFAVETKG